MSRTKFFDYRVYTPPPPPNWDSSADNIGVEVYGGEYADGNMPEGYDSFSMLGAEGTGLQGMESGLRGGATTSDSELLQQMAQEIEDLKQQLAERTSPEATTEEPKAAEDGGTEADAPESPLLLYLQQAGQTKLDNKQLEKILKSHGLSQASLSSLTLPLDAGTSKQLLGCFQELDPNFAKQWNSNPADPYRPEVIHSLTAMLSAALPESQTVSDDTSVAILDKATEVTWNGEKLKGQLTGKLDYAEGAEVNGRWVHCGQFVDAYLTKLVNGSIGVNELTNYLGQGNNDCDHGAQNRAIEIRRAVSAMYYMADKNPYLLRRYLKMIPEPALRLMKDYLGMDARRKDIGDQWDGQGTAEVLNWAIAGGTMPAGLAG